MAATWTGAATSAVLGVVWLVLAVLNPETTYHLAPLLVAAAWPVVFRLRAGPRPGMPGRVVAVAGGTAIAAVVAAVLSVLDALRGPTLTGTGDALTETAIAVAVGAVAGLVVVGAGPRRRR